MITVAGGFALMILVFVVIAVIMAFSADLTAHDREDLYARLGFISLGLAVASALAAIWLAVAGP